MDHSHNTQEKCAEYILAVVGFLRSTSSFPNNYSIAMLHTEFDLLPLHVSSRCTCANLVCRSPFSHRVEDYPADSAQ